MRMRVLRVGIVFCITLVMFPMGAGAENPTKDGLAESIAKLERVQKAFPVLPQGIMNTTCLVGTIGLCTDPDGNVTAYCTDPILNCEVDPSPVLCPEVCRDQGNVVVIDYGKYSCQALAEGKPYAFLCITPEEYAGHRSDCPAFKVPRYDSSQTPSWTCQIPIGNEHISTGVFDTLLFERSRTSYIQEHLEDQINELNNELKKICDCPGVLDPVWVGQTVYINECEANCALSSGPSSGQ